MAKVWSENFRAMMQKRVESKGGDGGEGTGGDGGEGRTESEAK